MNNIVLEVSAPGKVFSFFLFGAKLYQSINPKKGIEKGLYLNALIKLSSPMAKKALVIPQPGH